MSNEAERILHHISKQIRDKPKILLIMRVLAVMSLFAIAAYCLYEVVPRRYKLLIAGGDLLSNRHLLAKQLQAEAAENAIALHIKPVSGSEAALALLESGQLDLALVQGGLPMHYHNIVQVTAIAPELLHFLVRPDISDISQLRGKTINMGSKNGGTHLVTKQILEIADLKLGIDYVETNIATDELLMMSESRLPDAIIITSFAPSKIVDYMVKRRGYILLEVPFSAALALRLDWASEGKIPSHLYQVAPAVPHRDIKTVGVNLLLLANKNLDSRAVYRVLDSLYSVSMGTRLNIALDEKNIALPSGFHLSDGSRQFLDRKDPLFSMQTLDKVMGISALLFSLVSSVIIAFKWFLHPHTTERESKELIFEQLMTSSNEIELQLQMLQKTHSLNHVSLAVLHTRLAQLKREVFQRLQQGDHGGHEIVGDVLLVIAATRETLVAAGLKLSS